MTGKDVQLVVRAKDQSSKELDRISTSLKALTGNQEDLSKGASKTGSALGTLAADVIKLQAASDRLKSLSNIVTQFDKSSASVTRLQSAVRSSAAEFAKLARDSDGAAQAASRLSAQLSAEETSLAANKAALRESSKELTQVNKLVTQAEANQRRYNETLAKPANIKPSSALRSAGTFIEADLSGARTSQARMTAQVGEYRKAVDQSKVSISGLKTELSAAAKLQSDLANQTDKTATSLRTERDDLNKARTELSTISDISTKAGAALGVVSTSQDQVAQAATRMAANLAAAKAKMDALSSVKAPTVAAVASGAGMGVDTNALASQRRATLEAKKEWVDAQAAVKNLSQQMRAATAPTVELGQAFGQAQAQARLTKTAYEEQRGALARLGGSAQSTFASFAAASSAARSAGAATATANSQIASTATAATAGQRTLGQVLRQIAADMGTAAGRTDAYGSSLRRVQGDTRTTLSFTQRLRGEVLSLTASYIGFQAAVSQIGGAINAYRQLEAVQARLGIVLGGNTEKTAAEIGFLRTQADRLGISFGTLADEYGKFAVAAKQANFSMGDTRKIFLSVAEAARVNRLSVDQTQGVFLALTQMISKGKVSSEELRRQLGDRLTGAFNIFASAIGVSTAELDKMMRAGQVIADDKTLLKVAEQLNKVFGPELANSLKSATADIGRFQNDLFEAQLTIADGLIPGLQAALRSFDAFAKSAEGQQVFTNIGVGVGKLLQLLAELPKHFDLITLALKAFVAVKVGQVFAGFAASMVDSTKSIATFSRELSLVGPRTQASSASMGVMARAVAQVTLGLGMYQQALLATTSNSALARAATVGLAGTVGALRAGLILTATVARSFLAAFGGPVGLVVAGITLAVSSWIGKVDEATAALAEHKRQMDAVIAGYNEAKNKSGAWAKSLRGVTEAQAQANLDSLTALLTKQIDQMVDLSRIVKAGLIDFAPTSAQVQQYNRMADALERLRVDPTSIQEFVSTLNDIALNSVDDDIKDIALRILDLANAGSDGKASFEELAKTIEVARANLAQIRGTATDVQKALLKLPGAVDDTTKAFDKSDLVKGYTSAIDELKSKIPGLAEEMKHLKEQTDLNATAWRGMVDAVKAGNFGALGQIIKLWSQAGAASQAAADNKIFDGLPNPNKNVIDRIILVEGGQDGSGPSTSSARGVGQFTESTWLGLFDKVFPTLTSLDATAKLALRSGEENTVYQRKMLEALTKQNQVALVKAGVNPSNANTYLAHFLGAGDAIKVLLANPEALAKDIVSASSVKANPSVFKPGMTAGDLQQWAAQKMGGGSPIQSGGTTKQEDFDQGIAQQVKGLKEEADARKESNREATIAKALAQAEAEAVKQGTVLHKEQAAAIREAVGAKYDSAHADEQLKANQAQAREDLNTIIGLDQQRKTLLQEINEAQNSGDNSRVIELKEQLAAVNAQLTEAIPKAMELAKTLGDQKMVAQLMKVEQHTAQAGKQFSFFGLSFEKTKELVGNMADGIVGMFDNFAQSIANGVDAVTAFKNAFLQFASDFLKQIATMILRVAVLNALRAFMPGLGSLLPTGHTGGLVGSAAVGGGNSSRALAPQWFSNAMRFHTGGVPGLGPDEVPIIARRNEEMLTENDPRHRFNGGLNKDQPTSPSSLKQVLVLDPAELANAMASKAGEKVMLTFIKQNRVTLKTMLA